MTIDISKGVYLTTKEIIDYAEKHGLDATYMWELVIQKFVDLGAKEQEGRPNTCSGREYHKRWRNWKYLGVKSVCGGTYHSFQIGQFPLGGGVDYYGDEAIKITLDQLFSSGEANEVTSEDTPFQLEVGKIYKSGHSFVKIISEVDGLNLKYFVGIKCTEQGHPLAYVGLYDAYGDPDSDNNKECRHYLEPIPKEHPNVTKIKELEEQINKLKEEMK